MNDTNQARTLISRRHFLKLSGFAGALVATQALTQAAMARVSASEIPAMLPAVAKQLPPVQIGVLLPQSTMHPLLDDNFLAGMQLGLSEQQIQVTLVPMRYGTNPAEAVRAARELLGQNIKVLAGIVSANESAAFAPLLEQHSATLLIADVGANVLRTKHASPNIFRNSLNYWQANLALGTWAAGQVGTRAVMAASFYESGYDTLYAFRSGFEHASGTILDTRVTHHPASRHSLDTDIAAITATRPDVVYGAYSGRRAIDFVRAYAASDLAGRVPLVGPGFLTDERILAEHGAGARGLRTAFSWASSLETPANQAFTARYRASAGRAADPFAVLGYESMLMIVTALQQVGGEVTDRSAFQAALSQAAIESPRGQITFSTETREATSPLYLREVRSNTLYNAIVTRLTPIASTDERITPLSRNRRSGWINPFLAV